MNIYTASKFENVATVRGFNKLVRASGHTVTWDWTDTREFASGEASPITPEERRMYGMLDYAGVMSCDLLIFIDLDTHTPNGGRWEAGIAIGAGKKVWIVNYTHKVIFDVLPQVLIIPSIDEALRLLARAETRP